MNRHSLLHSPGPGWRYKTIKTRAIQFAKQGRINRIHLPHLITSYKRQPARNVFLLAASSSEVTTGLVQGRTDYDLPCESDKSFWQSNSHHHHHPHFDLVFQKKLSGARVLADPASLHVTRQTPQQSKAKNPNHHYKVLRQVHLLVFKGVCF